LKFGGSRSIFTELKLLGNESDNYSPSGPSIHVYKTFLTKLRTEDILRLQQKIYKPYLMIINKLVDAAIELKEFDKSIRLCKFDTPNFLNSLSFLILNLLYNKTI
jgi:hypothetical protein